MLLYELKKVLVRPVNRIALLILLAVMLIVTTIAVSGCLILNLTEVPCRESKRRQNCGRRKNSGQDM